MIVIGYFAGAARLRHCSSFEAIYGPYCDSCSACLGMPPLAILARTRGHNISTIKLPVRLFCFTRSDLL